MAPFKKLLGKQDFLFGKKYIPADFVFPDDPSHLNVKQAWQFLEHIRKRQRKAPDDVFWFRYWLNNEGELANPVLPSPEVSEVEGDEAEGSEAEDGSAEDDGAEDCDDDYSKAQEVRQGEGLNSDHDEDGDGGLDGTVEVEDLLPVIHCSAKAQGKPNDKVTDKTKNQTLVTTTGPSQIPKIRQEGKMRSECWIHAYNYNLTIQPKWILNGGHL